MSKWTHKGVEITFDAKRARFYADPQGSAVAADSLPAIKKAIDKVLTAVFVPFVAVDYVDGKFISYNVLGLTTIKGRRTYRNSEEFITDRKSRWRSGMVNETRVVPDTAENRELLKAWHDARDFEDKERKRLAALTEKARAAIPYIRAGGELK